MAGGTHRKLKFRSLLLAGASGVAATSAAYADESTPPPAADAQKWSWAVDAGGGVGSGFTAGKIDLLAPVWQDMDSLLFVRLGAGTSNKINSSYNLGLGYRTKIDPEWILGLYAGWDGSTTDFDHHSFNQVALGAELMSTDWDVRLNGYISTDNSPKTISNKFSLFVHDTRIAILQGQEAAYSGIDGEVGYRVFHTDDTDVRAFVGGFWFEHSQDAVNVSMGRTFDFSFHDLAGPKGRVEVNVFDLDELGPQSRLSFEGDIAHDNERGTTGFVGATVRIPLDVVSGSGAQALDDLDRRMIDPVRRSDNVLTQWQFTKPEPVVMYGPHMHSRPTNTVIYVDNSAGLGSYTDPTTLHDATTRTTVGTEHYQNSFIVITSKQGDIVVDTAAKEGVMQSGQSLVGGGETFHVRGTVSGTLFSHDFAPGTSDPTIEVHNGYDAVTLSHTNYDNIYGFSVEGYFFDAVYAHDVDHINISEMNIDGRYDGSSAVFGEYGIVLEQLQSQNLHAYMFGDTVHHLGVDGVLIGTDVTDGGTSHQYIDIRYLDAEFIGDDGLDIGTYANDSTVYQTVSVRNAFVDDVGDNGIQDTVYASNDAYVRQDIGIHDSAFYDAGNNGMYFYVGAASGAFAEQNVTIDPTYARFNQYGITFDAYAKTGAEAVQRGTLTDVYAGDNTSDNIRIIGYADNGGSVFQDFHMYNVDVYGSATGRGLAIAGTAKTNAYVNQFVYVDGMNASDNYSDNIAIGALAKYSSEVVQNINLYHVSASGSYYGYGIAMFGTAVHDGTTIQHLYGYDINANGNYLDNVKVDGYANTYGYVHQTADLRYSTASYSETGDGIHVYGGTHDTGTVVQGLYLDHVTTDGNDGSGVHIDSIATGGLVDQLLDAYVVSAVDNLNDGIYLHAYAAPNAATSLAAQYIYVTNDYLAYNSGYGLNVTSRANGPNAITQQTLAVEYSDISHNDTGGVNAFEIAYDQSAANQFLFFASDEVTNNDFTGVFVESVAVNQSFTEQTLVFSANALYVSDLTGNTGDGLYVGTSAFSGASTQQDVFLYGVNASGNDGSGLVIDATANGYGFGSSSIYYSHVSQNVIAAYDTFDHNDTNGIRVGDVSYYGGAMNQFLYFFGVDASHNTDSGFYMHSALTSIRGNSFAFTTNQSTSLYLIDSTFDYNGGTGIDIRSFNYGPVYAPAFFGGYSYQIEHILIANTDASHNVGSGLYVDTNARGRYGLDANYITVSSSHFDHNSDEGAKFVSSDYYGPGGFGDTFQQVSISDSSFNNNGDDGLDLMAYASGRQGRAEQHVSITGSYFDHNTGDGIHIYAQAVDGVYIAGHPCTTIQGLAGGCAFVRQNVSISFSEMDYNGGNGVFVGTYADNYGAIYGLSGRPHAPTVELYASSADHNSGRGLDVANHASNHSYLYQYVAMIDSTFDHNASDGIYLASYVGSASTMLQRALLYTYHGQASASYNAGNGFKATIEALGGSYARDVNIIQGVDTSYDGSFGIDAAVAYADGTSTGLQIDKFYDNTIDHNGDGVGLYSIGADAQQISYIGNNDIEFNAFVGVYGEANFGAFQYIGVYTFGNFVASNGTNYLFNSFGGSTQILN